MLLSALEQARLIRKREVSPLELTEQYLKRIENLNPQLGCFFHVAAESAMAEAKARTEQLAQCFATDLSPLFGVTTAIKDLNNVAGMPTSYGVAALKNNLANSDDVIVSKLKNAGLIVLGKTATSQLGSLPYTEPGGFAPALNPHSSDYTSGGSSGGSAAAVAANVCAIAQGSDGGGSIRGPAFCCGVVGLKPSRGRVSFAPIGDYQSGIATNGVLARTVLDAAAMLDVIAGYVPGDPYWLEEPANSFLSLAQQSLPPLRIGMVTAIAPAKDLHPDCQKAVEDTAVKLENLGHHIEPITLSAEELIEPFKTIWAAGVTSANVPLELLEPMNQWIASQSGTAGEYLQAVAKMQLFSRRLVGSLSGYDVLLSPVYTHPAIKVHQWKDLPPAETLEKIIRWILPCPIWNATGQPAIALPVSTSTVPVGIQLVGKPAAESTILAIAHQLELGDG